MAEHRPRLIGLIAFPGANLLDLSGPAQVFATAAEQAALLSGNGEPPYQIVLLSSAGGLVETSSGIAVDTLALDRFSPADFDTVLVSGGHGAEAAAADDMLIRWLQAARGSRRVGSICTGTYVLAATGLLDRRRVGTHWAYCDDLQHKYPTLAIERDAIFVHDEPFWTSAGVSAGMDMALAMVEQDLGRDLALLVARRLVLFLKRPGGQSQFSVPLSVQTMGDGALSEIVDWIMDHPDADLRTEALADRAGMTERTFHRAFRRTTGQTPAAFVEAVRLEHARRLLEDGETDIAVVANRSGFGHEERMRRAFLRQLGVNPSAYLSRFHTADTAPVDARLGLRLHQRSGATPAH